MKTFILIIGVLFLMAGFQNCSDVTFSPLDGSLTKIGELDPVIGEDLDDVVDDVDEDGVPEIPENVLEAAACVNDEGELGVLICHFPPGNPAALHTLCIGAPAVPAHLDHGQEDNPEPHPKDVLGSCEDVF